MDDIGKLPTCRRCGKEMKEISSREATIPLEVILRIIPFGVHPSSLRHFECPDKHAGAVLMPAMSNDEREHAAKMRRDYSVN